jgi:hypothetical protein
MSKTTFTDILAQVSKDRRALNDHKRRTFEWFRNNAKLVRQAAQKVKPEDVDPKHIMTQRPALLSKRKRVAGNMIGKMMQFYYDPKLKAKLPYYDTFPLIFPISVEKDRLLGLNMHYIPPNARAILMGHLYSLLEDESDEEKRIGLSYEILKSASKYRLFKPCIKTYLYSHVRSRYLFIPPKEWDAALMLPTARFEKASEQKVWQDSIDAVNKETAKARGRVASDKDKK